MPLKIIEYLNTIQEQIISYDDRITIEQVKDINPDYIISYGYRHIIKSDMVKYYRRKIINLHISLLPWNKGANPNFWSFWENTPKGVTIHYIDEGLDTGDIILQKEIFFDEHETLKTSYDKLQTEIEQLFIKHWDDIKNQQITAIPQPSQGSFHYNSDFLALANKLDLNWDITIRDLLNLKATFTED